jgi:hypothetical protein
MSARVRDVGRGATGRLADPGREKAVLRSVQFFICMV